VKRLALILATVLAGGCAVTKPAVAPETVRVEYRPAAASALVFASPVTPSFPLLGLDREARQPSAFLGYDDPIIESYFIYTDDQQNSWSSLDDYDRQAIYTKVGTRTR
jgi:hypothetical protein